MAQLPRGTVTFLFTDVESSTRLWAEYPQAMPAANARHETILRDAISRHGGFLYKITGDSLQAAFATAPAGLAAAYEAQHALIVEPWHESGLSQPLRTRIVLHVAAVDPEEDGYRSPSLNRLGRLLDAAHGGQVLLSAAAQALVWESLPAGTALRDLGQHRLKDLTQPSRIYQLLATALPDDFPPLRTLERYRNNLPLQPTIFLGREQEVATVTRMLRVPEARLLSLTGPGGTGKTRLSRAVSSELLDDFPAGVWFIDLSAIRDASLVPSAIAQALGIREEPARPILATLRDAMREWKLLLVLDNFEHVLAAAPAVADLLASAPGVKVLVTSREPLHLRGEREFPVPTFGVPDPREPVSLARLTQYEAVRLFISRAQDVKPDFTVDSENAPAVAEICHRLDGLPLAIELAAARIKLLPVEALRRRLEQRLAVLTSATRDVPERQRTLKAAIDWSHDLINPEEQTLFRRVAVFSNGFTLEAVDAVATDEVVLDSLTGIASLVDKSLLRQGEGSDGEPRFSLLTTIREYARERLDATAEVDEIRRRHAGWFLTRATEAVPHLTGPAPAPWLDRLEIEHDNLRAALHWALAPGGDPELGLRLATALSRFWFIRGHLFEGRRWLDQALTADQAVAPDVRAAAVQGAASLAWGQGDTARAGALYEEALQLATDGKDTVGVATALSSLGLVAQDAHQFDRARDYFQRAVAAFREGKETQRLASTLLNLGTLYYAQEDLARAEAALAESLALAREVGNTRTAALCLLNLGAVATDRDELDPAEELLNEALGLFRSIGDKRAIASCLSNMGDLAHDRGNRPAAAALLAEALALFQAVGDRRGIAGCLDSIARMLGPSDEAVRLFAAASEYVSHTGGTDTASVARDGDAIVSAVRLALGEPAFAAAWANGSRLSLEEAVATALAAAANVENERLASTSALC